MTLQEAVNAAGDSVYQLFDLGTGQEWTSPVDGGVSENLLVTVLSLGGDSAQIDELFQPGAALADFTEVPSSPASVPEPATLVLLSGASGFVVRGWAARKDRRANAGWAVTTN